jgi:hypothetical protein
VLTRAVFLTSLVLSFPAFAEEKLPVSDASDETNESESDGTGLAGTNEDPGALDFTQKELQQRFNGGLGVNLGPVMPWAKIGASMLWPEYKGIAQLSLGAGGFDFSDNFEGRNYLVQIDSQSAYLGWRNFPLGFGPIYVEPFAGFVRWSGSIKPRGFDAQQDQLASSLTSRFDSFGMSLGGNLGLMWLFKNGYFLDYNLVSLSWAQIFREHYSNNTSASRNSIRKQIRGPLTMSSLHLRFGYSFEF